MCGPEKGRLVLLLLLRYTIPAWGKTSQEGEFFHAWNGFCPQQRTLEVLFFHSLQPHLHLLVLDPAQVLMHKDENLQDIGIFILNSDLFLILFGVHFRCAIILRSPGPNELE